MRNRIYLSTIDPNAGDLARQYGVGLEIAEYCTAFNMDQLFAQTDASVQQSIQGVNRRVFHGPFNELFPCAIDPLARELAAKRFRQAMALARNYGAKKLILHGGCHPRLYYPSWFVEQSVLFWREFLAQNPDSMEICLENVLDPEPGLLGAIVRQVNDPRLRLCLDVGHANAYSKIPAMQWIEDWGEYLSHAHIHNNDGTADTHSALYDGTLPMEALVKAIPGTMTLELPEIGESLAQLLNILERNENHGKTE